MLMDIYMSLINKVCAFFPLGAPPEDKYANAPSAELTQHSNLKKATLIFKIISECFWLKSKRTSLNPFSLDKYMAKNKK